jgi:predicted O-methyltransferase YrrM
MSRTVVQVGKRVRSFLSRHYHRVARTMRFYSRESGLLKYSARGHFHSALPDVAEGVRVAALAVDRPVGGGLPGMDLRVDAQKELLLRMAELYPDFDWSDQKSPGRRFHLAQDWYKQADSICLYSMLRLFRPRRVVEVGSGFSSALMLDVDDRFLGRRTQLTVIEPNPDRLESLLALGDEARLRVVRHRVQDAPANVFSELESGDFLFIDSSHVSKVGSDVNFLFFEVLPKLPVGTFVHLHDVFWPFEYPAEWVAEGQSWSEAYLLRAFLSFNEAFEIVFWAPFAARQWADLIREQMPAYMINTGAAIWMRRVR